MDQELIRVGHHAFFSLQPELESRRLLSRIICGNLRHEWYSADVRWYATACLFHTTQHATLEHTDTLKTYDCPVLIRHKIEEKRRLRRGWHRLRTPVSKRLLNTATQALKQLLNNNRKDCIQTFLQGLTPTESTDYFLWREAKEPSPPLRTSQGTWARSNVDKVHAFAEHLANVFQPYPSENEPEYDE
jgi:hypothetical protein